MFEFECPRCKSLIGLELSDFFRQRIEGRDCPSCGAELELGNSALLFVFNGLVFGGLVMLLGYWGLKHEWLKVIIAVPLCWLMVPVIVQIGGRWRICSERVLDSVGVRRWSRAGSISAWIFGGAATMTIISFAVHYRKLMSNIGDSVMAIDSDAAADFTFGMKFYVFGGAVVAFAALAVTLIARWKTKGLRGR
jgi:hypothetical protein